MHSSCSFLSFWLTQDIEITQDPWFSAVSAKDIARQQTMQLKVKIVKGDFMPLLLRYDSKTTVNSYKIFYQLICVTKRFLTILKIMFSRLRIKICCLKRVFACYYINLYPCFHRIAVDWLQSLMSKLFTSKN